jgi:hypothetical protein
MDPNDQCQTSCPGERPQTGNDSPQPAPNDGQMTEIAEQLRCIGEYRKSAHQEPQALLASLSSMTSNFLAIEVRLSCVVRSAMEGPLTMDDVEAFSPPVDHLIRLAKQIAQLAQIQMKLSKIESSASPT